MRQTLTKASCEDKQSHQGMLSGRVLTPSMRNNQLHPVVCVTSVYPIPRESMEWSERLAGNSRRRRHVVYGCVAVRFFKTHLLCSMGLLSLRIHWFLKDEALKYSMKKRFQCESLHVNLPQ